MAILLLAVAAGVLYTTGVRRLSRRGRRWPPGRSSATGGALVLLAAAALVGRSDTFTAHVGEHLLLGMAAPLLLALGAPVTLALQALDRPAQVALRRALRARPLVVLTQPLVGWALFGGSLFALYFSPLFDLSERNGIVHAAVHLHFLTAGAVFLWPLVSPDPVPRRLPHGGRILLVLLSVPFHAVLGLALISGDEGRAAGGALLWAGGDLLGVAASGAVLAQWMRLDRREAQRHDRRDAVLVSPPPYG